MKTNLPGAGRAQRGETLVEVLVSLLVVTLATLLLASMATWAARVKLTAREKDETFTKALQEVEGRTGTPGSGTIVITDTAETDPAPEVTVPVDIYTQDRLTSYVPEGVPGP